MATYKIYHNPRCAKSREGLTVLESLTTDFEVIDYLKNPLSTKELKELLIKLNIEPIDLVRTNEAIWKEHYKGKSLTNNEIIEAMVLHPKLIQRPIIEKGNLAIIGRPIENVKIFLK